MRPPYMPWPEQAALIRERYRQPVNIDGVEFIPTSSAAQYLHVKPLRLLNLARNYRDVDQVITLPDGARFIRRARDRTDQRPYLYWDFESLRKVFA